MGWLWVGFGTNRADAFYSLQTMLERAETELYAESDDEEEEDEKDGEEE